MHEIQSRTLHTQPTLVVRGRATVPEIPKFLGEAYCAIEQVVNASDEQLAGPPFARYRSLDETYTEFDVEAGFPVTSPVAGAGEVEASSLPGGPAASTVHIGPYEELEAAYKSVVAWVELEGGIPEGTPWEMYLTDPNEVPDPTHHHTEIVQPYRIR